MDNNNNGADNRPGGGNNRFNSFWIYGIIALAIIGFQLISNMGTTQEQIDEYRLKQMIVKNDVEKILVINEKQAFIQIKENKIGDYEDAQKTNFGADRHHYVREIGSVELFEKEVKKWQEDADIPEEDRVYISYDTKENYLYPILGWLLPLVIIIAVWLFIMRRVSGGAGGPGAQIFNIGKYKATLFDQNAKVTVTFADDAGMLYFIRIFSFTSPCLLILLIKSSFTIAR